MSEKLKLALDKLAREYPEQRALVRDLKFDIDELRGHAERCEYRELIDGIASFAGLWFELMRNIPALERVESISARKEFYNELVELLRTRCGCR
jgi:hypothetical protein